MLCIAVWIPTRVAAQGESPPATEIDRLLAQCTALTNEGRFADVAEVAARAVALSRTLGDRERLFKSLNQLGASYFYQSRPADALVAHSEVLAIAEQMGRRDMQAVASNNVGLEYRELRDLERSRSFLERARSLEHALGRTDREANVLRNIAGLYLNMGAFDTAERYATEALQIARAHHHDIYEEMSLEMLAIVETNQKRHARALEHYQAALAIDDRLKIPALRPELLTDLGSLYFEMKEYRKAIGTLEPLVSSAHESGYRELEAIVFELIGGSHLALGDLDRATESLTRARDIYARLDDPAQRSWQVDVLFARLEKARGRPAAALESYRAALAAIERVRAGALRNEVDRSSVIATRRDAFVEAADLLVTMGRADEGLGIGERYRARVFLDLLVESRSTQDRARPLRAVETTLDAAAVQAQVAPGSALIEYLLGEPRSFAWVVTRDSIRVVPLAARSAIDARVDAYRQALSAPVSSLTAESAHADCDRLARALARLVIDPVEPAIEGAGRLTIVEDGSLSYVPFEALRSAKAPHYLVERFDIAYAPSASALAAIAGDGRGPSRAPLKLLAFGDPVYPADSGFAPLPNTRAEVDAIARLFPAAMRRTRLGRDARVDALSRQPPARYRYVHFATHAIVDERQPSRSGIVLSFDGSDVNRGLLRVDDISALRIDADLVTLSACSTGVGRLLSGEGMLGLARAFFYAGSRSVVMSLWNVNDTATAELMRRFYASLERGQSKVESIREAKIALLRGRRAAWRHPHYWAAFTLDGLPE